MMIISMWAVMSVPAPVMTMFKWFYEMPPVPVGTKILFELPVPVGTIMLFRPPMPVGTIFLFLPVVRIFGPFKFNCYLILFGLTMPLVFFSPCITRQDEK